MTYYIGTDHAGIVMKEFVKQLFQNKGHKVVDLGAFTKDRVDYPDFASKVCEAVLKDRNSKGILICGTGLGMSMSANKFDGIRAALCHNDYSAAMAREHNDANILCLGERVSGYGAIESIVNAWDSHKFQGGRHTNRIEKINKLASCRI